MSSGGGGGGYQASPEERALTAEQTQLLRQQRDLFTKQLAQQNLLAPFVLEDLGLRPTYGQTANPEYGRIQSQISSLDQQIARTAQTLPGRGGPSLDPRAGTNNAPAVPNPEYNKLVAQRQQLAKQLQGLQQTTQEITGYERFDTPESLAQKRLSELTLAEAEAQASTLDERTAIEQLNLERTLKGLRGELDIDPTLTRELESQEANLRAALQQQLGTGYETSTPGIEALDEFNRSKAGLIYGAQRDQITLGEQLSGAREAGRRDFLGIGPGLSEGLRNSQLSSIFGYGIPGRGVDFGGLSQGYSGPLSMMASERMNRMQAASNRAAGQNALFGSIIGAGAGLGAAAIFASDRRLKKDIKEIGETNAGTPIYTFKYKNDPEGKTFMGVMAQDVEKTQPEIVANIFGDYKGVDYSKVE